MTQHDMENQRLIKDIERLTIENERLTKERQLLRRTLVDLIGIDTREELEKVEAMIRLMPMPDVDRIKSINTIQALLQTL